VYLLSPAPSDSSFDSFSPSGAPSLQSLPPISNPRDDVELCRRGELRVEKFLQAATEIFLERGYRNARLADIVARAGGSLATLYRVFGNKEGLVHAIMHESIGSFGHSMDVLHEPGLSPLVALTTAAERMIAETLTPQRIVVHRIVIAQGLEFPKLRDWFFEHGVAPAHRTLAQYFTREQARGILHIEHPDVAADRFMAMVFGEVVMRSINGMLAANDLATIQAQTRESVRIFLNGVLPR